MVYDLGPLVGTTWHQYANTDGQVYYQRVGTQQHQWDIPAGWEDHPSDVWTRDNSRTWPQWRNQRTGRIVLLDPNPPPPQTYVEDRVIDANMRVVEQTLNSPEHVYRQAFVEILRFLFPTRDGFSVSQENTNVNTQPDFSVFKISCRPGGSAYMYEFALVESKTAAEPWGSTEDQCQNHCFNTNNESKQVYAIIQIGIEVQFYRYVTGTFTRLSRRLHLRHDVNDVTALANYMKSHPLPYSPLT